MVMVDVRGEPGILPLNTELIDREKALEVADSDIEMVEPS